jgi:hypothetical protein
MIKILQSIDAFLFEIAFLLISIPKTFFRVIFTPRWINSYVQQELKKDVSDRYDSYVSPMIFFVVIGVLPLVGLSDYLAYGLLKQGENHSFQTLPIFPRLAIVAKTFMSAPLEGKLTLVSVFLTSFPMGFAVVIQRIKRQPLTRSLLQPVFYTQCMCFAAFYPLMVGFSYLFFVRYLPELREDTFDTGIFGWQVLVVDLIFLAFIYNEVRIVTEELNCRWWRAIFIILLSYFVSIVFMVLLEVALLLLFVPSRLSLSIDDYPAPIELVAAFFT